LALAFAFFAACSSWSRTAPRFRPQPGAVAELRL